MTPLNFAMVGLRLLGLYLVVESGVWFVTAGIISAFIGQMTPAPGLSSSGMVGISWLPGGAQLILGLLLIVFSTPLARRLAPPVADESHKTACTFEEIQAIAFAVAGVLILAMALPNVGRAGIHLYDWWFTLQNAFRLLEPDHATSGIFMIDNRPSVQL